MKKLGLIFVVFLCFGLFLVPNKSFAQGNENTNVGVGTKSTWEVEKNAIVQKAISDMSAIEGYNTFILKNTQEIKLQEIANDYFKNANTNTNFNSAAASIYSTYGIYLASLLNDKRMKEKEVFIINAEAAAINNLQTIYSNAQKVTEGKLTPKEEKLNNAAVASRNANLSKQTINGGGASKCEWSVGSSFSFTACAGELLTNLIKTFLLNIAGFLVWISANMLNYSIQVSILDFKSWAPDTLYPIWIVIRQIVSLFVVFAGLYLGLMYIIGKDETFEKYIPWVIIFALFVNFSYPLTRTAVDISNVVSLNIYASVVGSEALTSKDFIGGNNAGSLIMNRLGLSKLVTDATKGETNDNSSALTSLTSPAGALMAVAFVLYAAYIFFMVTALIVMRMAVLVFLIVASPILFVDSIIPKLGDVAMKMRKYFIEQLFVAPVFMIMLALTLKFLEVFGRKAGVVGGGGASGSQTIIEIFNLTMMLIMLHIMITVTKKTAGSMGEMATKFMGKVGGFAGGAALGVATGGVGMLGRAGIGRAAGALRDSKWMTNRQGGFVGRHMYNMTDSVAKSSFDARNSSYVQAGASKLGLGLGMGSKMGYEEIAEQRQKNLVAHLGRVGTHKKTTYIKDAEGNYVTKDGKLQVLDKKGSTYRSDDVSEEAETSRKARKDYMDNAGGAIFASKQEKLDTRSKLEKSDDIAIANKNRKNISDEENERNQREAFAALANANKNNKTDSSTPAPTSTNPSSPATEAQAKTAAALERAQQGPTETPTTQTEKTSTPFSESKITDFTSVV